MSELPFVCIRRFKSLWCGSTRQAERLQYTCAARRAVRSNVSRGCRKVCRIAPARSVPRYCLPELMLELALLLVIRDSRC